MMGYPKRTAYCQKCGSVGFKIRQGSGKVDYVCSECYTDLSTNICEDYETLEPICKKCNSDVFKIKIQENNGEQKWSTRCVNCEEPASVIYIDDNGVEVNRILRELLVIKKSINKLESDIVNVCEDMSKLDYFIEYINNKTIEDNEEIENIYERIDIINKAVEKQKIKTINLDDEVSKMRNRLSTITNY